MSNLLAVFDALGCAALTLQTGVVVGINQTALDWLRLSQERSVGRASIEVLRQHKLEELLLRGSGSSFECLELEYLGRTVRALAFYSDTTQTLVLQDIGATKHQAEELREVMAVLSHEFRTPVTAIKSLLEALAQEPPEAQRTRFFGHVQLEVERLVRLIEDFTVGTRPDSTRRFAVGEAVERVLRLAHHELRSRNVHVRVAGEDKLVLCDTDKFVQVLLNLLENAARHGPNPGVVWVEASESNHQITVRVRDEGEALSDYATLFAAKRRGVNSQGSGMGLYIVHSIVTAWQGRVWGEAHAGGGNVFSFSVPSGN